MAGSSNGQDEEMITGINVTPLVDVVLVLLIILMVTATYILAKTIPMDLPRATTGEPTQTTLAISIDADGRTYLDGAPIAAVLLRHKVRVARRESPDARAVLAADGRTRHQAVIDVIDLLRQEGVTRFAVNVQPHDLRNGNTR